LGGQGPADEHAVPHSQQHGLLPLAAQATARQCLARENFIGDDGLAQDHGGHADESADQQVKASQGNQSVLSNNIGAVEPGVEQYPQQRANDDQADDQQQQRGSD